MAFHLHFAEASRIFQPVEDQKGAVRHSVECDTVTRKRRGCLEILEKHGALRGIEQRHPVLPSPGLVVNLELSKRRRLIGTHEQYPLSPSFEASSIVMSKKGRATALQKKSGPLFIQVPDTRCRLRGATQHSLEVYLRLRYGRSVRASRKILP